MEQDREHRSNLRDQKPVAPCIRRAPKLRDMFVVDNGTLSYANFHHEFARINLEGSASEALVKQQHRDTECRESKEDEIVKYMSSVPSYLEKGRNSQDKLLNVGVLDWGRLEKWRCSSRSLPSKHNGFSPANSSTSLFSTDASSPLSSGGQSSSPAWQRLCHRQMRRLSEVSFGEKRSQEIIKSCSLKGTVASPSGQSRGHFPPKRHQTKAYPWEFNTQNSTPVRRASDMFHQLSSSLGNNGNEQQRLSGKIFSMTRLGKCEEGQFCPGVERPKSGLRFEEPNLKGSDQVCTRGPKTVVLLLPRASAETRSGVPQFPDFSKVNPGLPSVYEGKSFPETNNSEKINESDSFDMLQSYSPSSQDGSQECAERKGYCRTNGQDVKVSSQSLHGTASHDKLSTCENGDGKKKPTLPLKSQGEIMLSVDLDARTTSESVSKSRNPSPIHKLGQGMARIIKSASSRDNSPQRRSISRDILAGRSTVPVCLDNACVNKSHANNRARSSPLRRLLDPLLKPRGSNCIHHTEKFTLDSTLSAGTCKPSNEKVPIHDPYSAKVRSQLTSEFRIGSYGSCPNLKHRSSTFHGLLRIVMKNGLPLFTFSVDNGAGILAATLRKSSAPGKDPSSWMYTFFTISEVKRKNAIWSSPGPKKNDNGYVPNVVAHMKASDQCCPYHGGKKCTEGGYSREFALLAADMGQVDQHESELLPTKELVAVVVKLPKAARNSDGRDEQPHLRHLDLSGTCFQEGSQTRHPDSCTDLVNGSSANPHALITTVILPGGVHTVPSKGAVSTLIQRWQSGGSCDCGGWDLGCQLRVYSNDNKLEGKTDSHDTCHRVNGFKLFSQVSQENCSPALNLVALKDRKYSVEFDSSVSHLQAFAICVAVVECSGRPSQSRIPQEESAPPARVPIPELIQTNSSKQSQGQVPAPAPAPPPARYFSYPFIFRAGRV